MLTSSHIELIKYITNNQTVSLQKLTAHFQKTPAFIRNEINLVNQHLPSAYSITIKNSLVSTQMEYNDFLSFMHELSLETYAPSVQERLHVMIVESYFREFLNLTKLYDSWGISLTTKKSDIKQLETYLADSHLQVVRKPGTGIQITGNMLHYRVLLIKIISECMDVYDFQIAHRGANTPIEQSIYNCFQEHTSFLFMRAQEAIKSFLDEYGHQINYYSNKFFILYVILALYPKQGHFLSIEQLKLEPLNLYLFPDRQENIAFNQVVSMIDFDPAMPFPHHHELYHLVGKLVSKIQANIKTEIHTKLQVQEELYAFVYRQYFFQHFHYKYEDKLVKETPKRYPFLYKTMQDAVHDVESYLGFSFNSEQLTSLTLIFSKWISKNRLYGRNRKKIVLVTNIGFERVTYFIEKLKDYIDFEHIATIDVNELHVLQEYQFDLILSFSSRTSSILKKRGYDSIKLKFFVDNEDLIKLFNAGCSIARRRIIARDLVIRLSQYTVEEQAAYLIEHYETLFL